MTKAKAVRGWQCQECGKRMTAKAAERAMFGADGCTKCGGSDIDLAVETIGSGLTVEVPATQAEVNAVVLALHRRSCGGTCEGCREQDARAAGARA